MVELGLKKVETGVDKLVYFLKGRGLVDLSSVATYLGTPLPVVQKWVDFLVEEKVLGIEYKFTKPFVYFIDKKAKKITKDLEEYKKKFETEAKEKDVPENKTSFLWKSHMLQELEKKREFFEKQVKLRNLDKLEKLWEEYKERIGS